MPGHKMVQEEEKAAPAELHAVHAHVSVPRAVEHGGHHAPGLPVRVHRTTKGYTGSELVV